MKILKVLILGGYGTFGGRLAFLLRDEPRVRLLIAGRSLEKAAAFCNRLGGVAERDALVFDRTGDLASQLASAEPDVLVDATGPFQGYGAHPYRLAEACIAHGIHYLDLADGSAFVDGIAQLDAAARARDVFVLSGVSSFPVLTAAVVRQLAQDMDEVKHITGGIAPSPYAGVGLNVIRAIASYAGQRLPLVRDGRAAEGRAFVETMRYTVAPPGRLPLRNIHFSLVDVPDLRVIPRLWPGLDSIWMGAGPVPAVLHRMLNGLARLVQWGLLPSLSPFARLFFWAINILIWGEHRGGMFVQVEGRRQGQPVRRSWHLLAEGDDGPLIPSMAIEAIILKVLEGQRPASGARPASNDLEVADYEKLFARRRIFIGRRNDDPPPAAMPLYQQLLGDAWSALPAPVRAMHELHGEKMVSGLASITRGRNPLGQLAARLFGFPAAGEQVPVSVRFRHQDGQEVWEREFAGRRLASIQQVGTGRDSRLLSERFGLFRFGLALVVDGDRLRLVPRSMSLLGLRLPLAWAPRGEAYETAIDGRFHFHVEIRHPLCGLIVCYRGWLAESASTERQAA